MAWITKPNGRQREVQNLGWLVKHWRDVTAFEVRSPRSSHLIAKGWPRRIDVVPGEPVASDEALLVAWLKDGGCYATRFASASVLHDWLHRTIFVGLRFSWFGLPGQMIDRPRPQQAPGVGPNAKSK